MIRDDGELVGKFLISKKNKITRQRTSRHPLGVLCFFTRRGIKKYYLSIK